MNEVDDSFLLRCANLPSEVVAMISPLLSQNKNERQNLRHEIAVLLFDQLVSSTKSIIQLCKINDATSLESVYRNSQGIIALSRVQAELSNKFYYLAVNSTSELELKRRFAYFALKAAVDYKKMRSFINGGALTTSLQAEEVIENARIDKIISDRKSQLQSLDMHTWPPFKNLNIQDQNSALEGKVRLDYIASDFDRALHLRLNLTEKQHFNALGNVAVHSSAFLLFTRNSDGLPQTFIGGLACTVLFYVARHLALASLEANEEIPEMKNFLNAKAVNDLRTLARGIKQPNYLYV